MFTIIQTDLKNILRDPSLLIICFVPFIMLSILRWGYPALLTVWPDASLYAVTGLTIFCITGAIMPGIAIAFAMLDEKDNNLQPVLSILPVSFERIVTYRLGVIIAFGFFTALLLLSFSGIPCGSMTQKISLALLCAATAPIMALIPAFFARDKIEGATLTKLLNFLIILPLPAFLFPGIWSRFMMIFPTWWIYYAFESVHDIPKFLIAAAGGISYHILVLGFLTRFIFKKLQYQ